MKKMTDIEEVDNQEREEWVLDHARWVVDYLVDRTWRYQVKAGWLLTISLALSSFLVSRFSMAVEKGLLVLALFVSAAAVTLFILAMVTWRISSPASGFVEWYNDQNNEPDGLVRTLTHPQGRQRRSVIIAIDDELETRSNRFKYGVWTLLFSLVLVVAHLVAEASDMLCSHL